MEQASSAFSTGVPALAAMPQLAGNSRQGFGPVASTMHWASSWVISSNTLGLSASLYDSDAGSRSTGKERDSESGNDYFPARYYASSMGRFLSPDWAGDLEGVIDLDPTDPQGLNLYTYGGNNPLSNTDPDGHDYYLQGGSQCGQNGVSCDQQGYVLGADGNRAVVTDAQLASGQYGTTFDSNGNLTSITTGQGTFGAQFFDASPGTVSATVYADPRISGFSQGLIGQINAYDQGAMPVLEAQMGFVMNVASFGMPVSGLAVSLGASGGKTSGRAGTVASAVLANKLHHIFGKPQHNLDALVKQYGSEEAAYEAIAEAAGKATAGSTGIFEVTVNVGGEAITVRGAVVAGIVKIGTAFKP